MRSWNDTYGLGRGWNKNGQEGHLVWKYAFLILFEPFRGVKVKGSEFGVDNGSRG